MLSFAPARAIVASIVCPEPHSESGDAMPIKPGSMQRLIDLWLSDDPPWDPDVLEHVEELAGRLDELRSRFGTL